MILNDLLWLESHAGAYMGKQRSTEEIYESLCNRIRQRDAGDYEQLNDKEFKKAPDSLLGLSNKIVDIDMNNKINDY